jgi:enoyl-CoA hydratase
MRQSATVVAMSAGLVDYTVEGHVAFITLDRPEARNAIDERVTNALEAAVDASEADDAVRVVILRAVTLEPNPVFCAGADLKAVQARVNDRVMTERGGFAGLTHRDRSKPMIAAVDGLATAGGVEILLACDLIIASTRSSFGLAEVKRNLVANAGGCYRLPRALGRAVALETIMTGNPLSARRAYELGMVNHLVEPAEVESTALALAHTIAANAPQAVRYSRQIALAADTLDDVELQAMGDAALRVVMRSDDLREGLAAFAEKRPPHWTGR